MGDYYVDGTIRSLSGTGSGTLADPWGRSDGTYQYAIDQIAAGPGQGSAGDSITNIAGSVNNSASGGIDLTVYGTPTNAKPLHLSGGDQRTEYDLEFMTFIALGNAAPAVIVSNFDFINQNSSSYTTDATLNFGNYAAVYNCTMVGNSSSTGKALATASQCAVHGCKFTNLNALAIGGGPVIDLGNYTRAKGNYFGFDKGFGQYGIYIRGMFSNNVVKVENRISGTAVTSCLDGSQVFNNSFYGDGSITGLYAAGSAQYFAWVNNYVENFNLGYKTNSGADAYLVAGNRGFNNTTPTSFVGDQWFVENNDYALTQSGVVSPSSGDFTPNVELINQGWHTIAQSQYPAPTIGAIAPTAGSGPSGGLYIPRIRG